MTIRALNSHFVSVKQASFQNPSTSSNQGAPGSGQQQQRIVDDFTPAAQGRTLRLGGDMPVLSPPVGPVRQQQLPPATPDVEALIGQMSELRAQNGLEALTEAELTDIRRLNTNELRMYEFTLGQLGQVAAGTLSPADYMFSVMDEAARLAGDDTRLFRHLVTFAFASQPPTVIEENLAGRHGHLAGSTIEETLYGLCGKLQNADQGFNPAVLDTLNPKTSTVTHHFSAFIELAQGALSAWGVDNAHHSLGDAGTNPGDVRNGNFGAMVGYAVRWGKMSPEDLSALVRWAYSASPEAPAPWGSPATDAQGSAVPFGDSNSHFELKDWTRLYNEAHPDAPITLIRE